MQAGAIVGIVLGAVALALIVGFLVYLYWWKPYHNKTRHAAGEPYATWDEASRRRKLMESYGLGDPDAEGATMHVDERGIGSTYDNAYNFNPDASSPMAEA